MPGERVVVLTLQARVRLCNPRTSSPPRAVCGISAKTAPFRHTLPPLGVWRRVRDYENVAEVAGL